MQMPSSIPGAASEQPRARAWQVGMQLAYLKYYQSWSSAAINASIARLESINAMYKSAQTGTAQAADGATTAPAQAAAGAPAAPTQAPTAAATQAATS